MIGSYIGAGIGNFFDLQPMPFQRIGITGYVILSSGTYCDCALNECNACYDINVVQGNDIAIYLSVEDFNGSAVSLLDIAEIEWTAKNAAGQISLQKSLGDGIFIEDKIILILQESDTAISAGQYIHQFVINYGGESIATVVKNQKLDPGFLNIRASSP